MDTKHHGIGRGKAGRPVRSSVPIVWLIVMFSPCATTAPGPTSPIWNRGTPADICYFAKLAIAALVAASVTAPMGGVALENNAERPADTGGSGSEKRPGIDQRAASRGCLRSS